MAPGYIKSAGMEIVYHEQWPEGVFRLVSSCELNKEIWCGHGDCLMASPEEAVQITGALKP